MMDQTEDKERPCHSVASPQDGRDKISTLHFALWSSLLVALAFPRVTLGLHTFFYRDFGVLGYPFIFYHREQFWKGMAPLWNPLSNCGAPFLAQWGTMALYPFSLIYLILPLPWSLNVFCLAHLVLGGTGMFLLTQRWVTHRWAAAVAGLIYMFNGVSFSCLMWPNYTVALGWLPWIVYASWRSWSAGGRWTVGAALMAAMQLLTGVPEIILFTWMLVLAFAVMEWIDRPEGRGRLAIRFGVVILLAAGLAAAQLLPFLDLLAHSQRDAGFATDKWAMPGWGWANLFLPLFHAFQTPQGTFFQQDQAFLSSYYMGGLVVVLAVLGIFWAPKRRAWLLGGLGLFGLIMALGHNAPLYPWLRQTVPILGVGRYAVKFVIVTMAVTPLLAAWAIRRLDEEDAEESRTRFRQLTVGLLLTAVLMGFLVWFGRAHPFEFDQPDVMTRNAVLRAIVMAVGLILLLVIARTKSPSSRSFAQIGLVLLLTLDAVTHKSHINPTLPASIMEPGLWQSNQTMPPPQPGQHRVLISPLAEEHLLRSRVESWMTDWMGKRLALWSNLNLLDGIAKVNGSSTLQIREQSEVQKLIYSPSNAWPAGLIDFLAVSQTTASNSVVEWTENPSGLPLITGGQQPVFKSAADTLAGLQADDFDPRRIVYLPLDAQDQIQVAQAPAPEIASPTFSPGLVEFSVNAQARQLIVIAQSYYHPWRAYLDDQPVPLWRANHAFQAVEVPAGEHRVVLRYQDNSFRLGLALSSLSLALCLVGWVRPGNEASYY